MTSDRKGVSPILLYGGYVLVDGQNVDPPFFHAPVERTAVSERKGIVRVGPNIGIR